MPFAVAESSDVSTRVVKLSDWAQGCRNVIRAGLYCRSDVINVRQHPLGHLQLSAVAAVSRVAPAQVCLRLLPGRGRLEPGSCTSERHRRSEEQLKPNLKPPLKSFMQNYARGVYRTGDNHRSCVHAA